MISNRMKRFLEEAKRMVQINAVSTQGNEEIVNYVEALMQDRGLKTHIQQVTHSYEEIAKRQFNVLGILGDPLSDRKIRKGLLLNNHLDTVSPGVLKNWTETQGDPFCPLLKGGKIFGLGTADAKLDFLCKLHAVERYRERKLKHPIYLVGTCGEALGMLGVKYLIKSQALNPNYVLVGGPTDLHLVYAHPSVYVYKVRISYPLIERDARGFNRRIDLSVFGRSAHSADSSMGQNAILHILNFLDRASQEGFEMRFTHLSGGDMLGKVPDTAQVQCYLLSHQFEDFKRFLQKEVKNELLQQSVRAELGGLGDSGVQFLPESLFLCLNQVQQFFEALADEGSQKQDSKNSLFFRSILNFSMMKQKSNALEMYFDMITLPDLSFQKIQQNIEVLTRSLVTRYPSLNVSVESECLNPGLSMDPQDPWIILCQGALQDVGLEPRLKSQAISTEAAQYFHAGYPTIVFGPGPSQSNNHSPNEYNIVEQMEQAIDFYEKVIEKVCYV